LKAGRKAPLRVDPDTAVIANPSLFVILSKAKNLKISLGVNSVKQSHEIAEPVPSFFEIASADFVNLAMTGEESCPPQ